MIKNDSFHHRVFIRVMIIIMRSSKMVEEDRWSSVPVRISTRFRLTQYKRPKACREKGEEILERIDDLINRLLDFYDEHKELE